MHVLLITPTYGAYRVLTRLSVFLMQDRILDDTLVNTVLCEGTFEPCSSSSSRYFLLHGVS